MKVAGASKFAASEWFEDNEVVVVVVVVVVVLVVVDIVEDENLANSLAETCSKVGMAWSHCEVRFSVVSTGGSSPLTT